MRPVDRELTFNDLLSKALDFYDLNVFHFLAQAGIFFNQMDRFTFFHDCPGFGRRCNFNYGS